MDFCQFRKPVFKMGTLWIAKKSIPKRKET